MIRNSHDNPTDRQVLRDLKSLGRLAGDETAAARAVARAIGAVEQANQPRIARRTFTWWRWAMPMGIAAALAIAVSVWTLVGTNRPVSAAELLDRAIARQSQYEGWVRIERRDWKNPKSPWQLESYLCPKTGQRITVLGDIDNARWEYVDPVQGVYAQYLPGLHKLIISDYTDAMSEPQPVTEDQILSAMRSDEEHIHVQYDVSRDRADKIIRLVFQKKARAASTQPGDNRNDGDDAQPAWIACDIDVGTSLVQSVSMRVSPDKPETYEVMRYFYDQKPLTGPRDMPIPSSIVVEDYRVTGEAKQLLDKVDAIHHDGVGFDTAMLVERSISPYGDNSRIVGAAVTILHHDARGRWLRMRWPITVTGKENWPTGPRPAAKPPIDWPEPTWEAVVAAVDGVPPESFIVCDGKTVWHSTVDMADGTVRYDKDGHVLPPTPLQSSMGKKVWDGVTPERGWRDNGIASLIWPSRAEVLSVNSSVLASKVDLKPDPKRSGARILTATGMVNWDVTPQDLTPELKIAIYYAPGLGPMPYRIIRTRYKQDGRTVESEMRWDFSWGSLTMFRDPVRVPLYWRRIDTGEDDPSSSPVYHLIPCPGKTVPEQWFSDPAMVEHPRSGQVK